MSMLSELGDFFETAGVVAGQTGSTEPRMLLGSLADEPDMVLCVYAYPGGAPEYIQNAFAPSREKPQIQVVARAVRYEDADDLAWAAWSALAPLTNAILGTTRYLSVRPNSSPALLRRDTNDRVLIFFNASVDKEVSLAPVS